MNEEELIYSLALTQIKGIGPVWRRNLLNAAGSATDVFRRRKELPHLIPGISSRICEMLDCPEAITWARKEYDFIDRNRIDWLLINSDSYPKRLRECEDAPLILFYKGNTDLNKQRVISLVGTRHASEYGKQLCANFLEELQKLYPDTLIVSGLAYGIDIQAHRSALAQGFPTIGVLAHGLDRIYPTAHRKTAIEMLNQGGLLTEYPSGTSPERYNFVGRNRIVAGVSDATIVIESAQKGGSLITAELAGSYHRECFAFPGRANDEFSKGCNQLIRDNQATLIQSAEDFVLSMGWDISSKPKKKAVQLQIFPDLSNEEQIIVDLLKKEESLQINSLVALSNIPVQKINTLLFELEMKGIVCVLAGGVYRLKHAV